MIPSCMKWSLLSARRAFQRFVLLLPETLAQTRPLSGVRAWVLACATVSPRVMTRERSGHLSVYLNTPSAPP